MFSGENCSYVTFKCVQCKAGCSVGCLNVAGLGSFMLFPLWATLLRGKVRGCPGLYQSIQLHHFDKPPALTRICLTVFSTDPCIEENYQCSGNGVCKLDGTRHVCECLPG